MTRTFQFCLIAWLAVGTRDFARAAAICGPDETVCYESLSYPIYTRSFNVVSGRTYIVQTSNLQPASSVSPPPAANPPDTVLWVLRTGPGGGTVIGSNDDINPVSNPASRVQFTAAYTGTALAVVSDYLDERYGRMDLSITENGSTIVTVSDQRFGGFSIMNHQVIQGDRLFVGKPPGGTFTGNPGNRIFYFSNSALDCSSNCGTYEAGAMASGTFYQLSAAATSTAGLIVVGAAAFSSNSAMDVRFFHSRLATAWGSSINADPDCDGLARQLEAVTNGSDPWLDINTCDSATGPSTDCSAVSTRKYSTAATWNARDTDNDGFRDDVELYGRMLACTDLPLPPLYDPGACVEAVYPACGSPVPGGYNYYPDPLALSLLDAQPREPDVFVEVVSPATAGHQLNPTQIQQVMSIYETEGNQCLHSVSSNILDCFQDRQNYNAVRLHIDTTTTFKSMLNSPFPESQWLESSYFNTWNLLRKNNFAHRLLVLAHHNGGVASRNGRIGRVMSNYSLAGSDRQSYVLAHEIGHLLGILGDLQTPQPNYVSLMNYTFQDLFPKKQLSGAPDIWPNDLGVACSNNSQCVDGFCDPACNCCGIKCARSHGRFSRGRMPDLSEVSQVETGQRAQIAASWECQFPSFPNACGGTNSCSVDYNKSGSIATATNSKFDADNGTFNPAVKDIDDWKTMRDSTKSGVDPMTSTNRQQPRFLVFGSEFESNPPVQLSPYPLSVTVQSNVTLATGVSPYTNAFYFPKTCGASCTTSNAVVVGDDPAIDLVSKTVGLASPLGLRFEAVIKVENFAVGTGHQIVHSNAFQMYISNSEEKVRWRIIPSPGDPGEVIASFDKLTAGKWYWVVGTWSRRSAGGNHQRLCVVGWDNVNLRWDHVNGNCVWQDTTTPTNVEMNGFTIGKDPTTNGWEFKGWIDQPYLWSFPGYGLTAEMGCVWAKAVDPVGHTQVPLIPPAPLTRCGE